MITANTALRMADTLLRVMGGETVSLRVTTTSATGDAGQVGLPGATCQDYALFPAVLRKVMSAQEAGGLTQYELLVSATAVESLLAQTALASAGELFDSAVGVVVASGLKVITAVSPCEAFSSAYLYALKLRDV